MTVLRMILTNHRTRSYLSHLFMYKAYYTPSYLRPKVPRVFQQSNRNISSILSAFSKKTPSRMTVRNDEAPIRDLVEDDKTLLETLSKSYEEAHRNDSSLWLNYLKTCYIYLYKGGGDASKSIAAFDLDGTIIKPKSNKRIPKSATDWDLFSVWTKMKIQQATKEARFVIFTNQNGVGLDIVPLDEVQHRVELVTKRLNIPCTVFVAIDKNEFRKPNLAMFTLFVKSFNKSKSIDLDSSFYCGDAVGYPSHSDADIKFAERIKIPFLPPEKFVRGVKPKLVEECN